MSTIISGSSPSVTFSDGSVQTTAFTTPVSIANGGTGATTLAGANIATTNSSTQSITSVNTFGFKNRLINGDMRIDQRNAGASVTPTSGQYCLDRFVTFSSQASKYSIQQNAGSVTPPTGFSNYLGVTSLSAYSIGSGDYFAMAQNIEYCNMADLAWGTANAKQITLSFWVYSSLTGTFGGALVNGVSSYSYPFTYSISTANTWTYITITISGPTSGSWSTTYNAPGLKVFIGLGIGSTYSGTAGSWSSNYYLSATGATSVVGTNGATFYITGVQLEVGSQATSFDFRDYGRELMMCQRYYETSAPIGTAPADGVVSFEAVGANANSSGGTWFAYYWITYKVTKRVAAVTLNLYGVSGNWQWNNAGSFTTYSSTSYPGDGTGIQSTGGITVIGYGAGSQYQAYLARGTWAVSAEL